MTGSVSTIADVLLKAGIAGLLCNEVRGLILAGPVLYGMYEAGGAWMTLWLGFCTLAGIAASVAVPLLVAKRFRLLR